MGDTPQGYGGTPQAQPGPAAVPPGLAKPVLEINEALKTMSQLTESNTQVMQALLQHLNRVGGVSKEIGKNYDYAHMELKSLLKDTANLQFSMDRIKKLQSARVSGGAGRQGTVEYVKNLQAEYKILLQVMNTGRGQGRYVKEIEKALDGLDKKLKQVEKQGDRTWDASHIQEVNAELERTAKNVRHVANAMSAIQVDKMSKGFKDMARTIDDAFGGQFSQTLQRIPGISGVMKGMRVAKQAGQAQRDLGELEIKRRANTQQAMRVNAANVYSQHGRAGLNTLRGMGYAGGSPSFSPGARKTLVRSGGKWGPAVPGQAPGSGAAAKQGGALDQMTVKAMTVGRLVVGGAGKGGGTPAGQKPLLARDPQTGGWIDKRTGKPYTGPNAPVVEAPLATEASGPTSGRRRRFSLSGLRDRFSATTPVEDVQKTMHGSGGLFSRSINKLVSGLANKEGGFFAEGAQGLLTRGAGSATAGIVEGALSKGSGLLSKGLGVASKAAVPLAVIGGIIQMRDKIAEENKKINEAFTGLGGMSTGRAEDFSGIRKSLLSTGVTNALRMGQGQEENMKIMSAAGESGLALGGTLRRGVDLGDALDKGRDTLEGGGFYGSVMKNAVYSGKNLGMGQDASTRLTMKLIEKFGQTTRETQKFFLGMDDMMQHSGVSASKYIEVIDEVTGQFNDMNRSLNSTLGILSALGKNGRLTGETMKTIMKDLSKPNQMSTAQRMYNIQEMKKNGDLDRAVTGEKAAGKRELEALHEQLSTVPGMDPTLLGKGGRDIAKNRAAIEAQLVASLKDKPEDLKSITSALEDTLNRVLGHEARAEALRSGDSLAAASAIEQGGESGISAAYQRRTTLRNLARMGKFSKQDTQGLLAGDPELMKRLMKSGVISQMVQQGTLSSGEEALKAFQSNTQVTRAGAMAAVDFGRTTKNPEDLLNKTGKTEIEASRDKGKYDTMVDLQRARMRAKGVNPDKFSLKELAAMFASDAKKNSGALAKELMGLNETFDLVIQAGSALQKAVEANTTIQAQDAAKKKAQEITDQTRTTAEIFAKTFEYLFDKVINFLDKMMNFLSPSWLDSKKDQQINEDKNTGLRRILESMDTSQMSEEKKKAHAELLTKVKNGSLLTGSDDEVKSKLAVAISEARGLDKSHSEELRLLGARDTPTTLGQRVEDSSREFIAKGVETQGRLVHDKKALMTSGKEERPFVKIDWNKKYPLPGTLPQTDPDGGVVPVGTLPTPVTPVQVAPQAQGTHAPMIITTNNFATSHVTAVPSTTQLGRTMPQAATVRCN